MHRKKLFQDERKQRGAVLRVMCLSLMMVVGPGRRPLRFVELSLDIVTSKVYSR